MAIPFPDNIDLGVGNPIDSKYLSTLNLPYTNIAAVNSRISLSQRYVGLTVNVNNVEYWYKNGVTDGDLILKTVSDNTITGATNGLNVNSGKLIGLGGTLTGNTVIYPSNYCFLIGGGTLANAFLGADGATGQISIGDNTLGHASTSFTCIKGNNNNLCLSQNCATFLSGGGKGIEYGDDYSGGFTVRSLPDIAWVTGHTGGNINNGERITKSITQISHGFVINDVIGWSGGTYNKAIANGKYNGEVLGLVTKVSGNTFDLTQAGYITGLTGLVTNTTYFLSDTTAGLLITGKTRTLGHIVRAVLVSDSSVSGWVLPYPGYIFITGGTGGGGTITGATNGLSVSDKNIVLGGVLTDNITISSPDKALLISTYGGLFMNLQNGGCYSTINLNAIPSNTMDFSVSNGIDSLGLCLNSQNFKYSVDCSNKYDCLSIPNVGWVTGQTSGGGTITGATNGLSVSGKNIGLGGALVADTIICGGTTNPKYGLCFKNFSYLQTRTIATGVTTIQSGNAYLQVDGLNNDASLQSQCTAALRVNNAYVCITNSPSTASVFSTNAAVLFSGDSACFYGKIKLASTLVAGTIADSVLVWNSSDKFIKTINGTNLGDKNNIYAMTVVSVSTTLTTGSTYVQLINSVSATTITLPATPLNGQVFRIKDAGTGALTKNITVARNGHLIDRVASDAIINTDDGALELIYNTALSSWFVLSFVS